VLGVAGQRAAFYSEGSRKKEKSYKQTLQTNLTKKTGELTNPAIGRGEEVIKKLRTAS